MKSTKNSLYFLIIYLLFFNGISEAKPLLKFQLALESAYAAETDSVKVNQKELTQTNVSMIPSLKVRYIENFAFLVIKFKDGHEQAISLADVATIDFRKEALPVNEKPPVSNGFKELLLSGKSFDGQAANGSKVWPFSIRFMNFDNQSGAIVGEITWKSLNAIHKIEGKLTGDELEFTETAYIKKGGADLNCIYHLRRNSSRVAGNWFENGQSANRTAWFDVQ